jgi:hypothetical protein
MSDYAVGKRALGICDRCGFQYRLNTLKALTINGVQVNLKVCSSCWEEDHPQNMQGKYPVRDPQALKDPRPDYGEYDSSRAQIVPIDPFVGGGWVGQVVVTTV